MQSHLRPLLLAFYVSTLHAQTADLTGRWRSVILTPNGARTDVELELKVSGATVTGAVLGNNVIQNGRLDGDTVTFTIGNPPAERLLRFNGQAAGDEIVFKATGIAPAPIQFVARRIVIPEGSVSDRELMQRLLKEYKVPGVSIAVFKDFKIAFLGAYGVADVETGALVTKDTLFQAASISKPIAAMASLKAVQHGKFGLDQDINTILKSWKLPMSGFVKDGAVTPRMLMSHTSGTGDAFGFPGYGPSAPRPTLPQILDGVAPSNGKAVRLERAPMTGYEYSGGAVMIQQLALVDVARKPFAQLMKEWVLNPIGMTDSTYEQPLPASWESRAARAHDRDGARSGDPWRVYPEQAAAGLWTTPADLARFAIEVQRSIAGQSNRVLKAALARELVTPVGVGPFGVGFEIEKRGEGWYFQHAGSSWGFMCDLIAHRSKGYGAAIMTNGDNGASLIADVLIGLIAKEYNWDSIQSPIPRRYGPTETEASQR